VAENGSDLEGRVSVFEDEVDYLKWKIDSLKAEIQMARGKIVELSKLNTLYMALSVRVGWLEGGPPEQEAATD
jgi:hypothetical protein